MLGECNCSELGGDAAVPTRILRSRSFSRTLNGMLPSPTTSRLLNETHFAVITGGVDPADGLFDLNRGELYGTAFQLAPSLFITARHVYRDAAAAAAGNGQVAVGTVIGQPRGQIVSDVEEFGDIDLAILRCEGLQTPALPFDFTPLEYLDEVAALGFPFGLNLAPPAPPVQILRAFRGYIVTRRGLTELSALAPPGYETSFVPASRAFGSTASLIGRHGDGQRCDPERVCCRAAPRTRTKDGGWHRARHRRTPHARQPLGWRQYRGADIWTRARPDA